LKIVEIDALLFTGGEKVDRANYAHFLSSKPYIVAADSAIDYLKQEDLSFDYALGDFDSVQSPPSSWLLKDNKAVSSHNRDKAYSDTALGLQFLAKNGYTRVLLIGGGGYRLDHTLSNLGLFKYDYAPKLWLTNYEWVWDIAKQGYIEGDIGQTVSFYALNRAEVLYEEGLRWPIAQLDWGNGEMSLSNELVNGKAFIKVSPQSRLLTMLKHKDRA
jgi:thiamine pyrophosphokinase